MKVNPSEIPYPEVYQLMVGAIAPRPIAFASTISADGVVNLSPYSFFNGFSVKPPILVFSPTRRGRDNTQKDTINNIEEVKEVVISVVNYDIVEQMSLSSTEYDSSIDEFIKSGLTPVNSELVKPPRVKESPVSFECKVREVIALGETGGAGNLVICEVLMIHVNDEVLDANGKIDPFKIDLVGRSGGNWYSRANGHALFEIDKPTRHLGIGVDSLPDSIRNSDVLTGNNLGKLGGLSKMPSVDDVKNHQDSEEIQAILSNNFPLTLEPFHKLAKKQLEIKTELAMMTLLVGDKLLDLQFN